MNEWTMVVLGALVFALVGGLVGEFRGRQTEGIVLGMLLGPIGCIIVLWLTDERRRCPECCGVVPLRASRCMHCASELIRKPELPVSNGVQLVCPRCGEKGFVRGARRGAEIECPGCGEKFLAEAEGLRLRA